VGPLNLFLVAWIGGGSALAAAPAPPPDLATERNTDGTPALWVLSVDGAPRPGDLLTLEIAAAVEGEPLATDELPQVRLSAGDRIASTTQTAPGRWQSRWRVPSTATPGQDLMVSVSLGGAQQETPLHLALPQRPTLDLGSHLDFAAGQEVAIDLVLRGPDLPPPQWLQVAVGEGAVQEVIAGTDRLSLRWTPRADPLPRAVPILVRDGRQPGLPPTLGVVRLVGHPRVPVETDPGAELLMSIGTRNYGPFIAGADGVAVATPDVYPGETVATVVARDELGNERRTQITLAGAVSPSLLIMPEGALVPGQRLPELNVAAIRGDGRPWTGPAPTCRTAVGAPLSIAPVAAGLWRAALPPGVDAIFDLRVECTLTGSGVQDRARATRQIGVEPGIPAAVRLRVWPPELSADLPVAQVQAWLEGPLGDRLPVAGLQVFADHGVLTPQAGSPAMLVASYDGSDTVMMGEDRIRASWTPPAGDGGVWRLGVGIDGLPTPTGDLPVVVQAQDRLGRPLPNALVTVSADGGPDDGLDDGEVVGRTDDHGRVALTLANVQASGPWVLRARSGSVERDHAVFAADVEQPEHLPGAELVAVVDLPVRTGDVRHIDVHANPERVAAGGKQASAVVVSLLDRSGRPVTNIVPRITASEGQLGRVRLTEDDVFEVDYRPPARKAYGTVELSVNAPDDAWSAHTRVEVVPQPLRHSLSVRGGWVMGSGRISSPSGGLTYEAALPWIPTTFIGRVGVMAYAERSVVTDDVTGDTVSLDLQVLPLNLDMLVRQEMGRFSVYAGAGLVVAPYRLTATYGDRVAIRSIGLATPGPEITGGAGLRIGSSELSAEISFIYLSIPPADIGFEGLIGGFAPSLGWKILF